MTIALTVLAFVLGTVFGSFINCAAWRIVHKESVLHGRSHCAECGHVLSAADLVPIFSWLFLRGRCRYCGKKISPRYVIAEALLGAVFALCYLRLGLSWAALRAMGLSTMLLGISLVDLDIQEIPDQILVYAIIWWLIFVFLMPEGVRDGMLGGILAAIFIGGGMLMITLGFDKVMKKETMGGGDIKLLFVVSLYLGALVGLMNLIISCIVGLAFVYFMRSNKIPFGPSISISTVFCLLFGREMINWYAGFFR